MRYASVHSSFRNHTSNHHAHQIKHHSVTSYLHANASEYTYTYTILFILCRIISDRFYQRDFSHVIPFQRINVIITHKLTFSRSAIELAGRVALSMWIHFRVGFMNNFSGHPKPQEPLGPSQELNGGEFRTCFVEGSPFSMLNLSGRRSRLPNGLTDDITTDAASMLSC